MYEELRLPDSIPASKFPSPQTAGLSTSGAAAAHNFSRAAEPCDKSIHRFQQAQAI